MPASSAAWMVAILSGSSLGPYIPDMAMHPRATRETAGPFLPSGMVLISMGFVTSIVKRHDNLANLRISRGRRRGGCGGRFVAGISGSASQRGRRGRTAGALERDGKRYVEDRDPWDRMVVSGGVGRPDFLDQRDPVGFGRG